MNSLMNIRLKESIGQNNSFDFIRYYLSFSVLFAHYAVLCGKGHIAFISSWEAVQGFFILSGFLVFYSYINSPNPIGYFYKRTKRILPAYFFIVLLCGFAGVFFTTLSAKAYFTSTELYKYLAANICFMNFLQPDLPGVFSNNIIHAVNGSLWTMKVEVLLYLTVPPIYWLMKKYNKLFILAGIFIFSILYNEGFQYLYDISGKEIYQILKRQVGGQLMYFYAGTTILLYFNYFQKYFKYIFPAGILLYCIKTAFVPLMYLEPLCWAILIIGIAYHTPRLNFLMKYDNIAYGIYLFHYPVIQIIINSGLTKNYYYIGMVATVTGTVLLAMFSWYLIEKPILKKNKTVCPERLKKLLLGKPF